MGVFFTFCLHEGDIFECTIDTCCWISDRQAGPEAWFEKPSDLLPYIPHDAILHMAFPVPSHLPRKATSQDISSRILSKVSSATVKTLNADLAALWVAELDEAILESKVHSPCLNCATLVY
jgi:hypothetical protein